jgi:hypothetical protein
LTPLDEICVRLTRRLDGFGAATLADPNPRAIARSVSCRVVLRPQAPKESHEDMSFAPDGERAAGPFLAPNRLIPQTEITGLSRRSAGCVARPYTCSTATTPATAFSAPATAPVTA